MPIIQTKMTIGSKSIFNICLSTCLKDISITSLRLKANGRVDQRLAQSFTGKFYYLYLLLVCLCSFFAFPIESLAQATPTATPEPVATPTLASLGDRVWLDVNQNGLQDADEPGIANVPVQLWIAHEDGTLDQVVSTTVTNEDGLYQFINLDPTTHYVVEFLPEPELSFTQAKASINGTDGTDEIDSDVDPDMGLTVLIDLAPGEESTAIDAGIIDSRGPLSVTVTPTITPTITLTVTPTATLMITATATATATVTATITATATATATATITATATPMPPTTSATDLGDRVWKDVNNNGIQDDGEPGVAGVVVRLWDVDEAGIQQNIVMTTTTDDTGNYIFINLPIRSLDEPAVAARYIVEFEPPENMMITIAQAGDDPALDSDPDPATGLAGPLEFIEGQPILDIDAGLVHPFSTLGNRVFEDLNGDGLQDEGEPGFDGVQVTLWIDSEGGDVANEAIDTAITANGGLYTFTQLSPKIRYFLEFTAPVGREFSPQDQGDDDLADSDVDPLSGLTTIIVLDAGQDDRSYDAGLFMPAEASTGSMGDRIWLDLNGNGLQDGDEPGIPDITLSIFDSSGNILTTTLTDGNGNYLFSDLSPDEYRIQVYTETLPAGLDATFDADGLDTPNQITQTLQAGEFNDQQDFGYQLLSAEISGILFEDFDDLDGNLYIPTIDRPIAGVILKLKGFDLFDNPVFRIEQTDFDGRYFFSNLTTGEYTVTVDLSSVPFGLRNENSADPDLVWHDLNLDGIQDLDEPGAANILLNLWTDDDGDALSDTQIASTTTSAEGIYGFIELNPNKKYFVEVIVPDSDGPVFTMQKAGSDDTADSDVDPVTGMIGPISLSPGQNNTRTDAGIMTTIAFTPTVTPTPEPIVEPTPSTPLLIANSYNASPGEVVVVLLEAFNIPELATATISLKYDPTVLEPLSCNKDPDGIFDLNQCNIQFGPDEIRFSIIALQNQSGNIRIAELTFNVIGTDGTLSMLTPSFSSNSDDRGNLLEITIEEGFFYVFDKRPGDVNCDGVQNSIDALFIMQYDLRLRETSDTCVPPARESRTLYGAACDLNEDDRCDAVDALLILQCNVGLPNSICPNPIEARSGLLPEESNAPLPFADMPLESPLDGEEGNVVYIETIPAGSTGTVILPVTAEIVDGLSSASIEIDYDPALFEAVDCHVNTVSFTGVCNPGFEQNDQGSDTVRFNVASVTTNVVGENKLATIELDILGGPLENDITLAIDITEAADVDGQDITLTAVEREFVAELETELDLRDIRRVRAC